MALSKTVEVPESTGKCTDYLLPVIVEKTRMHDAAVFDRDQGIISKVRVEIGVRTPPIIFTERVAAVDDDIAAWIQWIRED